MLFRAAPGCRSIVIVSTSDSFAASHVPVVGTAFESREPTITVVTVSVGAPSKVFPVKLTERAGKFYSKCNVPWVGYHAAEAAAGFPVVVEGEGDSVMPTDPDLVRARVRLLLQEGDAPTRLWRLTTGNVDAGWGTGRLCVICDEAIASNQVEYEVRSPSNASVSTGSPRGRAGRGGREWSRAPPRRWLTA